MTPKSAIYPLSKTASIPVIFYVRVHSPPGLRHVFENYDDNNDLVAFHSFFSEPQWQRPMQHDNLSIFSILFHLNLGLVFIIVFSLPLYAPDDCKIGFSTGWGTGWNKLFNSLEKDKSNHYTVY